MRSDACLEPPVEAAAPAVGFQYNGRLHTLRAKHVHAGVKGQPTFVDATHAGTHSSPCKPARPSPLRSSITRMPIGDGLWGRARISNPQDHAHRSPADHDGAFCFCAFHPLSHQPGYPTSIQPPLPYR